MMQHYAGVIGYLGIQVLAFVALSIRIKRHAKPLATVGMFLLDAILGIFVIGDLVYLFLTGRSHGDVTQTAPVDDQHRGSTSGTILMLWAAGELFGFFK